MSPVHLHLLLNHVPVIGAFFVLAMLAAAAWRRNSDLAKAALVAAVGIALVTAAVFLTGEPAEDAVELLAGVSETVIHEHEEVAETALVAMGLAGALALGLLVVYRRRALPHWAMGATLAAMLVVSGLMAWTANLGGQIRHTEIRTSATQSLREDADH